MTEQAIFRAFMVMLCLAFAIHSIMSTRNMKPYNRDTLPIHFKLAGRVVQFFFGKKKAITYEESFYTEEYTKQMRTHGDIAAFMYIILIVCILMIG